MSEDGLRSRRLLPRRLALDVSSLGLPNFRRLLAAFSISTLGEWAALASIPSAVDGLGGSDAVVPLVVGSYFIMISGVSFVAGGLGDKYPRRSLMIGADIFSFAAQASFAVLFLTGHAGLWTLFLTQFLLGAATGMFQPQINGMVVDHVPEESRQGANALRGIIEASGVMLGPVLGGTLLATTVGVGWSFALDALTFLISAGFLASLAKRVVHRNPVVEEEGEQGGLELRAGWRIVRATPWLAATIGLFAVLNAFAIGPFQALGAAGAGDFGEGAWGSILGSIGLGAILGGVLALAWKPNRPLFVVTAMTVFSALPMFLLAASAPLATVLVGGVLSGVSATFFMAVWETSLQDYVPEHVMSRVSSFDVVGSFALLPLGYVVTAAAVETVGITATLITMGALVLTGTALALSVPSVRQLGAVPGKDALARMEAAAAGASSR